MPLQRARFKISEYNRHRKSQISKHERRIRNVSLSLTSMVDMFAILVIFLLANSSTVSNWIDVGHGIQLPKAHASDKNEPGIAIQISPQEVYLDGKRLMKSEQLSNPSSQGALLQQLKILVGKHKVGAQVNLAVHSKVPSKMMKAVLAQCKLAGVEKIHFVTQPTSNP